MDKRRCRKNQNQRPWIWPVGQILAAESRVSVAWLKQLGSISFPIFVHSSPLYYSYKYCIFQMKMDTTLAESLELGFSL